MRHKSIRQCLRAQLLYICDISQLNKYILGSRCTIEYAIGVICLARVACSSVQVTVMKYLTPSGFDISKRGGVIPTISCNDYPHPGRVSPTSDTCILQALKTLEF